VRTFVSADFTFEDHGRRALMSGAVETWIAFESERIELLEVDADGRVRAVILFDPDDHARAEI
jgi:hypothetical protein